MYVLLKRNWYTEVGRFRSTDNGKPVTIPDELRDQLPSDAVETDEAGEPLKKDTSKKPAAKKPAATEK